MITALCRSCDTKFRGFFKVFFDNNSTTMTLKFYCSNDDHNSKKKFRLFTKKKHFETLKILKLNEIQTHYFKII